MMRRAVSLSLLAIGVLLTDQLTKFFATTALADRGIVYLVHSGISFYGLYSLNTKLAFSIPMMQWIIIIGSIMIIGALIVWLRKKLLSHETGTVPLTILIAAALGNVIDRLWHGGVVDFMSFSVGTIHFAIFNMADVFITGSIMALLLMESRKNKTQLTEIAGI